MMRCIKVSSGDDRMVVVHVDNSIYLMDSDEARDLANRLIVAAQYADAAAAEPLIVKQCNEAE